MSFWEDFLKEYDESIVSRTMVDGEMVSLDQAVNSGDVNDKLSYIYEALKLIFQTDNAELLDIIKIRAAYYLFAFEYKLHVYDLENLKEKFTVTALKYLLDKKDYDWLSQLQTNNMISKSELKNVVSETLTSEQKTVQYANEIPLKNFVEKILDESPKMKKTYEHIKSFDGLKTEIVNYEDANEIFSNEVKSKNRGEDLNSSVSLKRASILADNCHMLQPYPLHKISKEAIDALENLKLDFPNFSEVIEEIMGYAILSLMNNGSYFYMKPILLAGDPGVGKTAFAQKVSKILELGFKKLPFTTITATWVITGMDLSWSGSKQGKIFDFISKTQMANPIIFLDELDKGGKSGSGGNPMDVLHELLEKETATEFFDEAMNMNIDASKINWIATANHLDKIPSSILSRFKVFVVSDIEVEHQKVHVIRNVFKNILASNPNGGIFITELDEEIALKVKDNNIRQVNIILESALGRAAKRAWLQGQENNIKLEFGDVVL